MTKKPELLASYFTLAGGPSGREAARHISPFDFRRRAEAAAKAGFTGMGIWHTDLEHLLERWTLADLKRVMDDNGIVHTELEFLMDWYKDGEEKRRSDDHKRRLFAAAEVFGSRHIKVGDLLRTPVAMPRLIDSFAELCRDAAGHGLLIGYEMMPFCVINSLEAALALVNGAAQPNGGICFDLWHIAKQGTPFEAVARVPLSQITSIEINDGFAQSMPDLDEETTDYRQLCGEGDWDVTGFVKIMLDAGYAKPWGVEVLSKALRALPVEDMGRRAYDTAIAQFPRS